MTQDAFTVALLDPSRATPPQLIGPQGRPAGKRFDVYRNNVAVGLTDALARAFPVVEALVGPEFFQAMAGVYLRQQPPKSRMMKDYGDTFPRFLLDFPPVASLPYLPDVARLERALTRAYHAADAAPLSADALAAIPSDRLMASRITLAPAVQVLQSPHPILAIWRFNAEDGPTPLTGPQEVLVARSGFDPHAIELPARGAEFVTALARRRTLAAALAQAGPGFDLATTLTALLRAQAITAIGEPA